MKREWMRRSRDSPGTTSVGCTILSWDIGVHVWGFVPRDTWRQGLIRNTYVSEVAKNAVVVRTSAILKIIRSNTALLRARTMKSFRLPTQERKQWSSSVDDFDADHPTPLGIFVSNPWWPESNTSPSIGSYPELGFSIRYLGRYE